MKRRPTLWLEILVIGLIAVAVMLWAFDVNPVRSWFTR